MQDSHKLRLIKVLHTLVWIFFVTVIFYVVYSGFTGQVNTLTWIAIGLVLLEGLVLLVFRMFCPLTLWARKYSDSNRDNFDIYLPNWLARYNKEIFTTIYLIGVLSVLYRVSG
ncbi:MAG: hypothetical protein EP344_03140 [Bacteroidetes bacterium]|nr:MAG: hypothetical protein EP344_03140 [Bacteroidota bacterium]